MCPFGTQHQVVAQHAVSRACLRASGLITGMAGGNLVFSREDVESLILQTLDALPLRRNPRLMLDKEISLRRGLPLGGDSRGKFLQKKVITLNT